MQLALAIAVACFVLGVVAWPLVASVLRQNGRPPADYDASLANRAALETVYDAIRTLQVEHDLGRISDGDFRQQMAEYRREAALMLRVLDRRGPDTTDGHP